MNTHTNIYLYFLFPVEDIYSSVIPLKQLEKKHIIKNKSVVAHTCYSGGRDREDLGSKPAWANSLGDLCQKYPSQKRAGEVAQGIGTRKNSPN
jgi:hypothetical protein